MVRLGKSATTRAPPACTARGHWWMQPGTTTRGGRSACL